jgi:hypothetical protein
MYSKSLTTSNGCDSIARLNLTVLSSVQWFQDVQICAGETFNIGNQTLTQSGIYETLLTAQNGCDSTVTTTLMVLPPSISTQEVELCAGETYTINGETYSEAGVYSTTFQNSNGCDSTVTTSIVIDEIQVQVVLEEDTFTAVNFPTDATLQWVDCANDFSALENETSPVFNPSASGSYAVVVSNGECSETSSCENIIITSVDHLARNGELRAVVFPNPFEGDVELRLSGFSWPTHFTIFNTTGQAIRTGNITQDIVLLSLHGLATGLYTIKLEDSQGLSVTKNLVKE